MESEKLFLLCEECPYAAEEIWYRKAIFGYDPHKRYDLEESDYQTEYCICAKTGGKMAYWGFCGEAIQRIAIPEISSGYRKTGYTYRVQMRKKKLNNRIKMFDYGYRGSLGTYENHHIKLPKNSNRQRLYKKQTGKRIRHYNGILPNGGGYKKILDYWWNID